jgi:hypothetical protein
MLFQIVQRKQLDSDSAASVHRLRIGAIHQTQFGRWLTRTTNEFQVGAVEQGGEKDFFLQKK